MTGEAGEYREDEGRRNRDEDGTRQSGFNIDADGV